jgi:hypothetical protein
VSKEFFNAVKEKPAYSLISELKGPSGEPVTGHNNITTICSDFYNDLYTPLARLELALPAEQEILSAVYACISPLMALPL